MNAQTAKQVFLCLDSFDFKAIPSLNKVLVNELARGEFIIRRENIIALGPSGTGKTHFRVDVSNTNIESPSVSALPPASAV